MSRSWACRSDAASEAVTSARYEAALDNRRSVFVGDHFDDAALGSFVSLKEVHDVAWWPSGLVATAP